MPLACFAQSFNQSYTISSERKPSRSSSIKWFFTSFISCAWRSLQEKTICAKKLHLLSLFRTINAQTYTRDYLKHISAVKSAFGPLNYNKMACFLPSHESEPWCAYVVTCILFQLVPDLYAALGHFLNWVMAAKQTWTLRLKWVVFPLEFWLEIWRVKYLLLLPSKAEKKRATNILTIVAP